MNPIIIIINILAVLQWATVLPISRFCLSEYIYYR